MYTVYVLMDKDGHLYKGMTNNIQRRLAEHKNGKTKTTARMLELKLVYREEFSCASEARKREIYFKTAAGRRFLKKQLNKGA
jgi:putative endonuclease